MEYTAVAFRSRAETVKFYEYLSAYGVRSEIINTPKEAGVGCGLSVKIIGLNETIIKRAVYSFKSKSFAGIFLVKTLGGTRYVKSV